MACLRSIARGAASWLVLLSLAATHVGPNRLAANEPEVGRDATAATGEAASFFQQDVLPLLREHCFECHAEEEARGGFQLDTRSRLVLGGDSGAVIDFEHPESSVLMEAVRYEGYEMPPRGKLPDAQIAVLQRWVAMGVPYPENRLGNPAEQRVESPGTRVTEGDRAFWSFQPIEDPAVPRPARQDWCETPIDAFIAKGLEDADLQPNPAAEPEQLIRRLHYDLTGLPPSELLVAAYVADPSPAHYAKIVDRLLASPEYGERWGRHWLDLVRYAETNSYERDNAKPEVWRYRDYVIDSFNAGKPFDLFTAEQLAGDEMPYSDQRLIATGYYRLGLWDDEPADPKLARYDELDDIVATTSQVFLGLTINCARCHEHKIDPIPHADYYRMLSFFAGVNRYGQRGYDSVAAASLRPLAPPQQSQAYLQATEEYKTQKRKLDGIIHQFERRLREDLVQVEKEEFRHEMNRVPLARQRVGKLFKEAEVDLYERSLRERRELQRNKPPTLAQALCVTEAGSQPPPTHVLTRGNPHAEADPVEPRFPEVLGGKRPEYAPPVSGQTSGRRSALAAWITDPKAQPLTARVTANRLWQYHFGRGIVRTPNDFGFQGSKPTHPELLDFLASRLIENDWHLKPLHRMMVLSATYQMSSQSQVDGFSTDPDNNRFWRFNARRLTAEEIRDSMLAVAGRLNRQKHGPSMYPIIEPEVLAGQSRPGSGWGNSSLAERSRRSIYIHLKRSLKVPLLASFDVADADFTCPVRFATTQPTQALGLINGRYARVIADAMAADVARRQGDASLESQVTEVLTRVLQREPEAEEITRGVDFINELRDQHDQDAQSALELFCLLAINLNEFIYLD